MKLVEWTMLSASAAAVAGLAAIVLFNFSGIDADTVRTDALLAASCLGFLLLTA